MIETAAYLRDAKAVGMTVAERLAAVESVARDPAMGDIMEGTGGVRKFRVAGRGHGKSGGYRIISYFGGDDIPVFLLGVLSKGEMANLSKSERNALRNVVSGIADDYRLSAKDRAK